MNGNSALTSPAKGAGAEVIATYSPVRTHPIRAKPALPWGRGYGNFGFYPGRLQLGRPSRLQTQTNWPGPS